jgi:hypothetical protein
LAGLFVALDTASALLVCRRQFGRVSVIPSHGKRMQCSCAEGVICGDRLHQKQNGGAEAPPFQFAMTIDAY